MKKEEFLKYLDTTCWSCTSSNDTYSDWEYERSYADFIYDYMTVWYNEEYVSVSYKDIGWGYTNIENYEFSYEEFIAWCGDR